MPEGDTVRRAAERLHLALAGRELSRAELRWPNLGGVDLAGRTVLEVVAYGKHILTRLAAGEGAARIPTAPVEPLTLRSHLRMDGSWQLSRTGAKAWPPPDRIAVRAALANAEWTAIGLWLGMLDLVPTIAEGALIGHLGPDILAADFADPASPRGVTEALRRLGERRRETIGGALLDQRNLAGIGTFYMAETLFVTGVSPWTPVSQIADLPGIVERARRMLSANLDRATPTTTGDTRPGKHQWVHARSGQPCRRCGTTVRVAGIAVGDRNGPQTAPLERTAFYCPQCQPGPTPTDDGRGQRPLGTSVAAVARPAGYRRQ